MLRDPSPHPSNVVIGIFSYASDARRALNTLREHQFSAQEVTAAFREPPPGRDAGAPVVPGRHSGQWFGQLRQLYHGSDRTDGPSENADIRITSEARVTDLETMLARIDLSDRDTQILERDLDRGGAILTVTAGTRNAEAQRVMEQRGAHIIHGHSSNETQLAAPSDPVEVTSAPFSTPPSADPGHIQLFGEVLRVRKEKVDTGDVRVRKEAVTHMETVQVPVTREHLVVEHTDGSGRAGLENSIRIPLSEERVHIDKDTVLREEYKVGKREVTQNEAVRDTVRRERLLIDDARARDNDEPPRG
jgi:uncharacterized protein (TIGR02271 family)